MKRACSKSSIFGFTLVELLIVISILAILFSIGLVQYTRFNRQQILDQAVLGLKNNLAHAREMALSGKKGCEGIFDGVLVRFDEAENEYSFYSSCNNKADLVLIATYKVKQVSLGSYPDEILFKNLTGGTDFSEEETIVLVAGSGSTSRTGGVLVAPSGKLEIVSSSLVSCSGCWSGSNCEPGTTLNYCGTGGALCLNCNDNEECTINESCVAGVCQHENQPEHWECDYHGYPGECLTGVCTKIQPTGYMDQGCAEIEECSDYYLGECVDYEICGPGWCWCVDTLFPIF